MHLYRKPTLRKLLTNLTADVDSIKLFISQAIVSIISSAFIIIGASVLLLTINWKLALCVIAIIPIIGVTFFVVLKKVRVLFIQSRAVIDWLNKVINESILGAAIIRVVNSQQFEYNKFLEANTKARDFGLSILKLLRASYRL
jgi:ATP-binding cassette subfamily B protein